MGRIKTQLIRRHTSEILEKFDSDFTKDFNENKKILDARVHVSSKKMRNVIAGHITKLKKQAV